MADPTRQLVEKCTCTAGIAPESPDETTYLNDACRKLIADCGEDLTILTAERDALREAADSLALKLQAYVDMTGNTLGTGALKRYADLNNSTTRDETAV